MQTTIPRYSTVILNQGAKIRGIKPGSQYKVTVDESRSEYLFISPDLKISERQTSLDAFIKYKLHPEKLKPKKPIRKPISLIDYYYNKGLIKIIH